MHVCTITRCIYNSNGGLVPKIGLVLGKSWMVNPMSKHSPVMTVQMYFPTVIVD